MPDAKACFIRPSTFLQALKLAMGARLALAPAALAFIYNRLRDIVSVKEPGHNTMSLSLLIIYAWLHHRFGALFQEAALNWMKTHFPGLIYLADASSIDWGPFETKKIFMKVERSSFTLEHRMIKMCLLLVKSAIDMKLSAPSYTNTHTIFWWLVSIYLKWPSLRINDEYILEPYTPHRVARSFGYAKTCPI